MVHGEDLQHLRGALSEVFFVLLIFLGVIRYICHTRMPRIHDEHGMEVLEYKGGLPHAIMSTYNSNKT